MRRLLFTGFNAFGQHEFVNGNAADCNAGFSELKAPFSDKNQCTISIAWRYSALAFGRKLWLRGLLAECPNECVTLEAPGDIKALAAGDTHCLVLLHNGQLYRVKPNLKAELLPVRLEAPPRSNSGTKRSIFGIPKVPELSIEHIACGSHINVAVSSENAVYSIPSCLHQFPGRQFRVKQLECGHEHAVLLNGNGDVFTWGNGLRGQLGQAVLKVEEAPLLVEALAGIKKGTCLSDNSHCCRRLAQCGHIRLRGPLHLGPQLQRPAGSACDEAGWLAQRAHCLSAAPAARPARVWLLHKVRSFRR
ncbi:RCC1 domain-containing protein 1 isoform X2 [Drosophila kikkawai]|uniref:RCC1 domain-containing protein 1 isoform X2 n=1 Tax=Drosophila kikkawai TaxID=30033 RepID=A0A6P4ICY0_DROKI|nr:RCC1 domain-containing protein 1 isoform X2 [Drosophila kikkawai]